MIQIELGVDDLASTRFGVSPLAETVRSLRALSDPAQHTMHLPWIRSFRARLNPDDAALLQALIGPTRTPADFRSIPSRAIGDFLTPVPSRFMERFEHELAATRNTPIEIVRRDLIATHAPDPVPEPLRAVEDGRKREMARLLNLICDTVERYWHLAMDPAWPQMRLVLEADTTYRARQLALGGAQLLFADIHPNVRWDNGVLTVTEMVSEHLVVSAGRGLLLMPSIFAPKPVPPLDPHEPPSLAYPSRGLATLWGEPPQPDPSALIDLLGETRTLLLQLLEEPMSTLELSRRLKVTPSAVSQHLRVLHATGLVTRARDRRQVLYRRTPLGDHLTTGETA